MHKQFTREAGHFDLDQLDDLCPDWRERETWVCGPNALLDDAEKLYEDAGLSDQLHLERFSANLAGGEAEGGTVTFAKSDDDHGDRRRHHAARGGRGSRAATTLRLPHGHLPHLCGPV